MLARCCLCLLVVRHDLDCLVISLQLKDGLHVLQEEVVSVPVTTMEKSTVEVPETVMEKFTVDKPVTVTRDVPETVRDVETRCAPAMPCNLQVDLVLLWALLYSSCSFVFCPCLWGQHYS